MTLRVTPQELDLNRGQTATASEVNRNCDKSTRIIDVTSATVTLSENTHESRYVTLNRAAGIAVTLPAATGSGSRYRFIITTTVTSNTTTITAAAGDFLGGTVLQTKTDNTFASYHMDGTSHTTLTFNGTTKGGIVGDYIELFDASTTMWHVKAMTKATGVVASPVS